MAETSLSVIPPTPQVDAPDDDCHVQNSNNDARNDVNLLVPPPLLEQSSHPQQTRGTSSQYSRSSSSFSGPRLRAASRAASASPAMRARSATPASISAQPPQTQTSFRSLAAATARWIWPCILIASSLLRFDVISAVFGLAFIVHSLSYIGHRFALRLWVVRSLIFVAGITLVARIIYQAVAASSSKSVTPSYISDLFGFIPIASVWDGFRQFLPDAMVFFGAIAVFFLRSYADMSIYDIHFLTNSHHRKRKRVLQSEFINNTIMFGLIFANVSAAIVMPNFLSAFYMFHILLELLAWTNFVRFIMPLMQLTRNMLVFYTTGHMMVLYIYQLPGVSDQFSSRQSTLFGLKTYFADNADPFYYAYVVSVLLLFIFISIHGTIYETIHVGCTNLLAHAASFTHRMFYTSASRREAVQANPRHHRYWRSIKSAIARNAQKISSAATLASAITFPSYLTLPLLLWATFTMVAPALWFNTTRFLILVYFIGIVVTQYIFNLGHVDPPFWNEVPLAGLKFLHPEFFFFGIQIFFGFVYAVLFYRWDQSNSCNVRASSRQSIASSGNFSINPGQPLRQRNPTFEKWNKIKDIVVLISTFLFELMLKYAYLISLVILYICGLQQVNVLNAVFLLYFVTFLIFPSLARSCWLTLVVYTEIVIILQFVWQLAFPGSPVVDNTLWGLLYHESLWYGLRFHLVILTFTIIQYDTYELLYQKERQARLEAPSETAEQASTIDQTNAINKLGKKYNEFLELVLEKNTRLVCYCVMAANGLVEPLCLFNIGYLGLLFFFLSLHQFGLHKLAAKLWIFTCLYPGAIATSFYLFQFPDIQEWLFSIATKEVLQEIGFFALDGQDLFKSLIRHVIILLLCVLQFRMYRSVALRGPRDGKAYMKQLFPQWMFSVFDFFRRLCVMHIHKAIVISIFFVTNNYISLIGLGTLIFLTIVYTSPKLFTRSCISLLMLWIQFLILSRLIFQLGMIQNRIPNYEFANYLGYATFDRTSAPVSYYIRYEIIAIFFLSFGIMVRRWKQDLLLSNPHYPPEEWTWPLFTFGLHSPSVEQGPKIKSTSTLGRLAQSAVEAMSEFSLAVNYWFSNFFHDLGVECCLFVFLIVALCRFDTLGLVYLACLGFWLAVCRATYSKLWVFQVILIAVLMSVEYFFALGMPPGLGISWPWSNWSLSSRLILSLPASPSELIITPDFFLFFFCVLLLHVFKHNEKFEHESNPFWSLYFEHLECDFTLKPRKKADQVKFVIVRYFIWVAIILAFMVGTATTDLLSFVYLCIALYFISYGEGILINKTRRLATWEATLWYSFTWFSLKLVYQIPAYILSLEDGKSTSTDWTWQSLIGLHKMTLHPSSPSDYYVFSTEMILCLLLFFALLLQRRLNRSTAMFYVVRYIIKDSENASTRAANYKKKKKQSVQKLREQYEINIAEIREKVRMMKTDQKDVDDWVNLYGRQEDDHGYAVIDLVEDETNTEDHGYKYDVTNIDYDDNCWSRQNKLEYLKTSDAFAMSPIAKSPSVENILTFKNSQTSSQEDHKDAHTFIQIYRESRENYIGDDENVAIQDKAIIAYRSWLDRFLEKLIEYIYGLAIDYTDLYVTDSQEELIQKSLQDSRIWAIIKGLYYALCAHTTVVVYLFVYANQVYHGTILSLVPALAVLLVGMCQRPYPSRKFWQFLIVYTELTIFVKYFFQFGFWGDFNSFACPKLSPLDLRHWVTIIGIKRGCGAFFFEVTTELGVLISCVIHRGLMRRLGIWKNVSEAPTDKAKVEAGNTNEETEAIHMESAMSITGVDTMSDDIAEEQIEQEIPVDDENHERFVMEIDNTWESEPQNDSMPWYRSVLTDLEYYMNKLLDTSHLLGEDYYVPMFVADVLVFILTILFWTSFSGDSGQSSNNNIQFLDTVINQNIVPPLFISIVVLNFTLILIDRAIYISKNILAKMIMQLVTVLAFNFWIFFVLPPSNNESFFYLQSLQLWYFVKCTYWYFSGLQIKRGYPRLQLVSFFMRSYSSFNRTAFYIYRVIPFVWELRSLIDWTLCGTSLKLVDWFKFEDIYANLYFIKCERIEDRQSKRYFGQQRDPQSKHVYGTLMVLTLVVVLWFPFLILSFPFATQRNPVIAASINLQINGFEPLYSQSVTIQTIRNITGDEFAKIREKNPELFPSYYSYGDMQQLLFQPNSMNTWSINPLAKENLIDILTKTTIDMFMTLTWQFERPSTSLSVVARGSQTIWMSPILRESLVNVLNGSSASDIFVPMLLPRFIRAFPNSEASNLASGNPSLLRSCILKMRTGASLNNTVDITKNVEESVWWELFEQDVAGNQTDPGFFTLSDTVPISGISSYGIIGLYVAVVFTIGRFIRQSIADASARIIYDDLPNPDAILEICADAILAREFSDYETEETLYWQLITLFRSPRMLLEKTRLRTDSS